MNYAQAQKTEANRIPVIDITALREGGDAPAVAQQLHRASRDLGFIYVKGHGIADETIYTARLAAYDFFRAPEPEKAQVVISSRHRGWLGRGGAKMQDGAKADLKESFIWGIEGDSGALPDDHALRGENQWPDFLPQLRTAAMDYFNSAHNVANNLMRGIALGLDLEENFFLKNCAKPLSRASFVYYPPQAEEMGAEQFGVGPHTDFGVLTVLCQDSVGGLQVKDANGVWIEAPPIEGTLIVNVGDLLARWTDGAFKSTPHRVVNRSGRERLSLVLAFDPDPETLIDARAVFGADYKPRQAPITCGDYLTWRFERAFAYRQRQ